MIPHPAFAAWRIHARHLLAEGVPPEAADWDSFEHAAGLFSAASPVSAGALRCAASSVRVAPDLMALLELVACHRDPRRYARMYRLLWRVTRGERALLEDAADADVAHLSLMARAVRRASHKMTAFVRFRAWQTTAGLEYVAVFEPEHAVLQRTAPFFVKRFGSMQWTIVTPDGGARWDRRQLQFFTVDPSLVVPGPDAAEALWITYYESIFNPARLNVSMMCKEMPQGYWKNLPEAASIPALVASAVARAGAMVANAQPGNGRKRSPVRDPSRLIETSPTDDAFPHKATLDACRRCSLAWHSTQAVAGEGPRGAALMLVGEQPGDEEDLAGRPFIGPAGKLLRRALGVAGIDATTLYITNAVKHFSFEPRGKRRVHKTPAQREIEACMAWLDAEVTAVVPRVIVALGATALAALTRQRLTVTAARGTVLAHRGGARICATYHPSAVLRAGDDWRRRELQAALEVDLAAAALLATST